MILFRTGSRIVLSQTIYPPGPRLRILMKMPGLRIDQPNSGNHLFPPGEELFHERTVIHGRLRLEP